MRKLVRQARLLDGGDGISAADNRGGSALGGFRERLGDAEGPGGKSRHLEDSHRAVPDDRLGLLQKRRQGLDRVRADIDADLAVGNGAVRGDLRNALWHRPDRR